LIIEETVFGCNRTKVLPGIKGSFDYKNPAQHIYMIAYPDSILLQGICKDRIQICRNGAVGLLSEMFWGILDGFSPPPEPSFEDGKIFSLEKRIRGFKNEILNQVQDDG
jgi:hypothetical protein